eukprot:TRINITY_DN9065_c0_g1_i1.p1 TRINITY_DN9065_c0_g1~~TRINITY_DN9065_c0_g1_i1.p1  ORF type:complete len:240 (+),score=72.10 TRINITY_DN9065_c0_g1_i1:88-807(+)
MFTGIVEEMGRVISLTGANNTQWSNNPDDNKDVAPDGWVMVVEASVVLQGVNLGDSIAVNGVCLTVTSFTENSFTVGLSPETLRCTNLGDLQAGQPVNLERSLTPHSRMGGHFVQGHVDGTGVISNFRPDGDSLFVTITAAPKLVKYVVRKGYIAVDGTSLTVVDVGADWFSFMLVAYTQQKIVVPKKQVGDRVNLEVDIMGKYIEKFLLMQSSVESPDISLLAQGLQQKLRTDSENSS